MKSRATRRSTQRCTPTRCGWRRPPRRGPGLVAQQELDDAEAKDRAAEAQVESAKSALSAARQQLEMSQATNSQVSAMSDYTRITAPFDGVVTWRYADTGALVQAGTSNNNSAPVVKLAQVNILRLRIPVPESLAASVRIGQPAEVTVSGHGRAFHRQGERGSPTRSTAPLAPCRWRSIFLMTSTNSSRECTPTSGSKCRTTPMR